MMKRVLLKDCSAKIKAMPLWTQTGGNGVLARVIEMHEMHENGKKYGRSVLIFQMDRAWTSAHYILD